MLFFVMTFLVQTNGNSQSLYRFPQPGMQQAEMYHGDWTTNWYPFNNAVTYVSDTVVGQDTFSLIVSAHLGWGYTFYDSGKVYYHYGTNQSLSNPYSGELLYDFSLNVGDTITLHRYLYNGLYTVTNVSSVLLANGQTRKYMELSNGTHLLKWIDAIGDIEHGLFYSGDFEGGYEEFICHSDSTGPVYSAPMSAFSCSMSQPVFNGGNVNCSMFNYNVQITGDVCGACTGGISLSGVSGGVPGYTYLWSDSSTASSITAACTGTYTVTIMDSDSNSCTRAFYIPPSDVNLTVSPITHDCTTGEYTICITPWGGTAPYFYQWNTGEMTSCITVYTSGTYSLCITDANGCVECTTITIQAFPPLSVSATVQPASCFTCCDGNVVLTPSGGAPGYAFTSQNWAAQGNFCVGTYYYCVTDSIDCSLCDSVQVSFMTGMLETPGQPFHLFPNPASGIVIVQWKETPGVLRIYDRAGREVKHFAAENSTRQELDVSDLAEGVYFLSEESAAGIISREKLVIVR
jgi:hypothetical protein